MMSTRWDLYAMDPALILVGLIVIVYMVFQERLSWKWIFFFGETILYWFANGVLAKWNANLIGVFQGASSTLGSMSPVIITLILFATGAFMAIILKPLATWSTGMAHHRRWWMYGSIAATALALVFTFVNAGWFEAKALRIVFFFITGLLLGMSISANSLYFLFANEQFYYRIAPALTGALISVTTLFGTFAGNYAMEIDNVMRPDSAFGTNGANIHLIVFIVSMCFLGISSLLIFLNKENPETVRGFDFEVLSQLPKYSKKVIWTMIISLIGISAFYALTQSSLVTDFIETKLMLRGSSYEESTAWVRAFGTFDIVPQIILGYFIYKYITKNVGFKAMMMGAIPLTMIACVILVFTANPYAFIFLNLVIGIVTSQIFFAYFSMAIMWNYRSHGFPVTGFASASNSVGPFVVNTIINELRFKKVGIYKDYTNLKNLDINKANDLHQLQSFNKSADDVTTILFAAIVVCLVVAELWIYFTAKNVFADYLDIKTANANLRKLLRVDTNKKIETRVDSKQLEMEARHE